MTRFLILLTLTLFTSCSEKESTFQICATNEKLVLSNDIYNIGDTVILVQTLDPIIDELGFEIDHNWIMFSESYKYLESTGYYKAVVIK